MKQPIMMVLNILTPLLLVVYLIPLNFAKIQINVVASENESERAVELAGIQEDIISDSERNTFQLSDNNLKNLVRDYFGQRPDDAFVRSPTPWGDLYATYGWPQVTRILTPLAATTLKVTSQPTIVLTQTFENNSTNTATFTAKIQQSVENTVTSTWDKGGELTVGQEISYGFDIKVVSVEGTTSFYYTSRWGESVSKSESVTLGSESGVEITLAPGQKVVAELYATRGSMLVQVDYAATLSGWTALNYKNPYQGHHFWGLSVSVMMEETGYPTEVTSTEVISLGFYSNSMIVIRDAYSGMMIHSIPVLN